jgi:hypothetical protein
MIRNYTNAPNGRTVRAAIAHGRTTVEKVRKEGVERIRKHRKIPLRNGKPNQPPAPRVPSESIGAQLFHAE